MPTNATPSDSPTTIAQKTSDQTGDWRLIPWLFVAILACLLASFPIRNADVYGHLASGRSISEGFKSLVEIEVGKDASSNHLLFDYLSYAIFMIKGGLGLGVIKSLAIALLAIILLANSRDQGGWLIPVFATGLAILTMGSRLLYQSETFSYVFLGLTFWYVRPVRLQRMLGLHPGMLRYAMIWVVGMLLLVVWGGTDQWYVLGLLLASAWLIGYRWDEKPRRSIGYLAVNLFVCITVSASFAIKFPAEFFASGPMPGGTQGVMTPFSRAYVDAMAGSPAGMAFFPLIGLSGLSFLLQIRNWSWARFLPWLLFAGLASYQIRTAPFFAVVAGPIFAWNLQDFFSSRSKSPASKGISNSLLGRLTGQFIVALLGLAFLASAWVGWLQSPPFEPRRLGIEISPSLEESALETKQWKIEGKLGKEPRLLHLSAATRHVFAWFCPDVLSIRNDEIAAVIRGEKEISENWESSMRASGITHVVVYDNDRGRLMTTLDRLFDAPAQWTLMRLQGRVAIFSWRDPQNNESSDQNSPVALTPDELLMTAGKVPGEVPQSTTETNRRWWHAFWKSIPPSFDDRDEASVRILQAEVIRRNAFPRHVSAWEATQLAGMIGSLNGWSNVAGPLLDANQRLVFQRPGSSGPNQPPHPYAPLARAYFPEFTRFREDSPASLLYLAIRSARQALARNPRDAQAYANLGEAYLRLLNNSRERGWAVPFNELVQLRRAQAIEALNRAVELDKDLAFAHSQLGAIYREMGFLDLSVEHTRAYLSAIRKSRKAGTTNDDFLKAVAGADEMLERESKIVEDNRAEFEKSAAGLRVLDRAILARDLGLAGLARDILLKSDISAFGASGLSLELELLVRTGRAREVRDWTSDEQEAALGANYYWLRVQALAATGEYALARAECTQLGAEGDEVGGAGPRLVSAVLFAQAICDGHRVLDHTGLAAFNAFSQAGFRNRLGQLLSRIRRDADAHALRGILSLELGDTSSAAEEFRKALINWRGNSAIGDGMGVDFNARFMCQKALEWMNSVNPALAE